VGESCDDDRERDFVMSWADHAVRELTAGRSVTIKPRGNSMRPHIESGAEVLLEPYEGNTPAVDDIVLCRVSGRHYLHFVKATRTMGQNVQYQIGNARGGINGWIRQSNIFGCATAVNGVTR
jgi:hypothetical protein